jgi:TatA/E family protein of Tat protein translocase
MNPIHLAFIAMIALIFLGPKRLPELAKTLGSGMREFRETMSLDHSPDAPAAFAPPSDTPVTAAVASPGAPVPPLAPALATATLAPVPPLAPPVALRPPAPVPPLAPTLAVLRPPVGDLPPDAPAAA